jgi:beta-lactamase regulating signal transducer with metallopeptidase domain
MSTSALQFLLGLSVKGTILLAATALAAILARRARASVRHALWAAGLTGLLLVPLLAAGLPRWEVVALPLAVAPAPPPDPVAPPYGSAEAPATIPQPRVVPGDASVSGGEKRSVQSAPTVGTVPGRSMAEMIFLIWASGAALILAWLIFGHLRVRSIIRASTPTLSPVWRGSVQEALEITADATRVEFRETVATMPMASGILRPVVLLPASGIEWSPEHRRDVVLHELAHVRRRDCLTHLASRIACALHWFNPLAWLAARQARVEREHACDDAVLAAGALPSSYAQALLDTARRSPPAWAAAAAGLTMARPSHLSTRLLAVLDEGRRRGRLGRKALGTASVGTLALLLPVAALAPARETAPSMVLSADSTPSPAPAAKRAQPPSAARSKTIARPNGDSPAVPGIQNSPPCPYTSKGSHRTVRLSGSVRITGMGSTDDGKGNRWVAWTGADCSVVVHAVGEPVFTEDETDVAEFRGSGRFTVTHAEGNSEREYEVRGDGTSLTRTYTGDRLKLPIDEATRRWVAALVLQYIRQSAYQAEARTQRILRAKGMPGLIDEIEAIPSGWARGRYYAAGIAAQPNAANVSVLLDHAGTHLDSDYEKGRILAVLPNKLLGDPGVRTSYLSVTRGMESDYEKAKALLTVSAGGLDPASTRTALEAATTVTSAYERGRVLVAVIKTAPSQGELDPLYFDAVIGVDSDYEKAKVLTAYAQHPGIGAAGLDRLYRAAGGITSAYELANVLVASIAKSGSAGARCDGYLTAVTKIDSDFEKARAMSALQLAGSLTADCAKRAAAVAGTIQSNNDRARVLIEYAARGLLTDVTRAEFFGAARTMESSFELRRVLTAVLAQGQLSQAVLLDLLETAGGIDSDNDLASVLVTAAGTGMIGDAVRPAYLRVAGRMSSDYERRRALTAIGAR